MDTQVIISHLPCQWDCITVENEKTEMQTVFAKQA